MSFPRVRIEYDGDPKHGVALYDADTGEKIDRCTKVHVHTSDGVVIWVGLEIFYVPMFEDFEQMLMWGMADVDGALDANNRTAALRGVNSE